MSLEASVVVPVRDDPRIDALLESLASQRGAPEFEILVALDGSRRAPRIPDARSPLAVVRPLALPPRGPYAARNAAAREARAGLILFTDSDGLVPPDWVARAVREMADPTVSALQGGSVSRDSSRRSRWIQAEYDRYVASHEKLAFRRFCNTRNFAIRTELWRRNPFPERFPRGGDGAYGLLLEREGVAIRYVPDWAVEHRHASSLRAEARKAFDEGRDGARWKAAGVDLFGEDVERPEGPGAELLSALPRAPVLRRLAAGGLLGLASGLAAASVVLPESPASRAFARFRRACHLAGRLVGEATAGAGAP
jgi:glycosyltransferase involved in cell wall biosynthesis